MKVADMPARRLSGAQLEEFQRLVLPHLPVLVRSAKFMSHSEVEADDLVQETMVKALQNFGALEEAESTRPWLLTILRRAFVDRYRATHRYGREVPLDAVGNDIAESRGVASGELDGKWESPDELLERFDDDQVVEAIRSLPEEIRWTLMLVDVEQLDQARAAGILEVPVGTVKSRTHRGRAMLRDRLFKLAQQRGWLKTGDKERSL